ncbi:MAG: hypothetical protein R3242_02355 [Akkermansiaceae bacterium]|nr:hypothetical protein [Akkermansiaceae bacterium]
MNARLFLILPVVWLCLSCTSRLGSLDRLKVSRGELVRIESLGPGIAKEITNDLMVSAITRGHLDDHTPTMPVIAKVDGVALDHGLFVEKREIAVSPGKHRIHLTCSIGGDGGGWHDGPYECDKVYEVHFEAGYSYYVIMHRPRSGRCDFQFLRQKGALRPYQEDRCEEVEARRVKA